MIRRFSLILLLGALLGLFAQGAAFAYAPMISMQDTTIAAPAMSEECAEMMGTEKSPDKKPCQGLTLDCIAKMGCSLPPLLVASAMPFAVDTPLRDLLSPLLIQKLDGRMAGPEPDPPLILG